MKMNRKWHPKSWSQQAREMADRRIENILHPLYGEYTIEDAYHFFNISYRAPLIVYRAVKIFNRKMKRR